jgi:hypothetical protein
LKNSGLVFAQDVFDFRRLGIKLQKQNHMKRRFYSALFWAYAVGIASCSSGLQAQVTITADDMFNQVGLYYRAYANNTSNSTTNTVAVSTIVGAPGGPQAWNFSDGSQDVTFRFDYIQATNGASGSDFASLGAQLAEQKTDEASTNSRSWLYFAQDTTKGRIDYGFYDPTFSASQPEATFSPPLQDFPKTIHYGDTWQGNTVFTSVYSDPSLGDFPDQVTYTSTDKVDAYGVVVLPGLGFLDCLRVHEMVQYDIAIDLGLGDGFQNAGTQYILNYYWLCPGHGIAAQMTSTSPSDGSQPPDNLPGGAAAFVRMFETNHPDTGSTNQVQTIKGFTMTLGKSGALLQWTQDPSLTSYRIDYSTNLTATGNWQALKTVTNNFLIDVNAGTPGAPSRCYRVVGQN